MLITIKKIEHSFHFSSSMNFLISATVETFPKAFTFSLITTAGVLITPYFINNIDYDINLR